MKHYNRDLRDPRDEDRDISPLGCAFVIVLILSSIMLGLWIIKII